MKHYLVAGSHSFTQSGSLGKALPLLLLNMTYVGCGVLIMGLQNEIDFCDMFFFHIIPSKN